MARVFDSRRSQKAQDREPDRGNRRVDVPHASGGANSLYNPVCFGTVEPYGNGSRIRAGFKLDLRDIAAVGLLPAMTALALLGRRSTFNWVLFAISLILLVVLAVRNRGAEPMRARLIEVLSNAANQARKPGLPYTDPTF